MTKYPELNILISTGNARNIIRELEIEIESMNILVTTDFSADSEVAIKYAIDFIKKLKVPANLTILHCIDRLSSSRLYYSLGIDIENIILNSEEEAAKAMNDLLLRTFDNHDHVTRRIVRSESSVGNEIVKFLDQNPYDLLVISRKGQTALSHVFFGSVSEYVVRHAKCPVVLVPAE